MIDMQTVRVSALNNRVPSAVLLFEVIGAAVGLGLLALYLAVLSRGVVTVVLAAAFVSMLLLVTFDLDRPTRGFVTVPDTPLVALRASMELPRRPRGRPRRSPLAQHCRVRLAGQAPGECGGLLVFLERSCGRQQCVAAPPGNAWGLVSPLDPEARLVESSFGVMRREWSDG